MYAGKNIKLARKQAQANADYFKLPYRLFLDCAGNIRIERLEDCALKESFGNVFDEIYKPRRAN